MNDRMGNHNYFGAAVIFNVGGLGAEQGIREHESCGWDVDRACRSRKQIDQ